MKTRSTRTWELLLWTVCVWQSLTLATRASTLQSNSIATSSRRLLDQQTPPASSDKYSNTSDSPIATASSTAASNTSTFSVPPSASAGSTSGGDDASCNQGMLFQKLFALYEPIDQCFKEGHYELVTQNWHNVTQENIDLICNSKNCTLLFNRVDDAGIPSCKIKMNDEYVDLKEIYSSVRQQCNATNQKKNKKAQGKGSDGKHTAAVHAWSLAVGLVLSCWLALALVL